MPCLFIAGGCATAPRAVDAIARASGYERLALRGETFAHVAYFKQGRGDTLHVYIEHDGTPWIAEDVPAADPTPRNPLMLRLMLLDSAPALYLGRPCYFGWSDTPPCEPIWWTHRRYSRQVVQSMVAALRAFLADRPQYTGIDLLGYSGGGVLAVLMVSAMPEIRRVVTVAAPLDVDAWAALHRYSPLAGSINPARQPPLRPGVLQLHVAGGRDELVPPHLIERFARSQTGARFLVVAGFTHTCCWERIWTDLLIEQPPR